MLFAATGDDPLGVNFLFCFVRLAPDRGIPIFDGAGGATYAITRTEGIGGAGGGPGSIDLIPSPTTIVNATATVLMNGRLAYRWITPEMLPNGE